MRAPWTVALAALTLLASEDALASTIYESATMGPGAQLGGPFVGATGWLGVRFATTLPTRITTLGGHLWLTGGGAFVAIFPVDDESGLPPSPPDVTDAVFTALVPDVDPSAEVSVDVDVELPPGEWSIVFGSGAAGATGFGYMPGNNESIGVPSYFFANAREWFPLGDNRARFFAYGTACGDTLVEAPEGCDDGNDSNTDECLETCVAATCGDGFLRDGVEGCDDGNLEPGDGCATDCSVETAGEGGAGGSGVGGSGEGGTSGDGGGAASSTNGATGSTATVGSSTSSSSGSGSGGGDGAASGDDEGCGCAAGRQTEGSADGSRWVSLATFALVAAAVRRRRALAPRRA